MWLLTQRPIVTAILVVLLGISAQVALGSEVQYFPEFSCEKGAFRLKHGVHQVNYKFLGKPLRQKKIGDQGGDSTIQMEYRGLTLFFYMGEYGKSGLLDSLILTDSAWGLIDGVDIGSQLHVLKSRFKNINNENSPLIEICGDTDCVKFHFRDKRIYKIEYSCYTG